jgi:hypothetical protein
MQKKRFEVSSKALIIYLLLFIFIIILIVPKEIIQKPGVVGKVVASVRIIGANAPTFDHDIDDFTIAQTDTFVFDVNCSDIDPLDEIKYYDNFTGFEINRTTGIINQTAIGNNTIIFNQSLVGNNTIKISCSDDLQNTTKTFVLEITNVNEAPVLSSIGSQIATEDELFTLDVDATDPENDTLIFNASTTLFTINNETGLINFTPTLSQVGNHTINISVFDGEFYDYEVISLRIVRGPYCGDNSCSNTESCSTCSEDCGTCPVAPAEEAEEEAAEAEGVVAGGVATGIAGAAGLARAPYFRCDEKWECSDWNVCSLDGIRTRTCKDINKCGTKQKKPSEIAECAYQPTCSDGIQNGGETGVDCGGPCEPCLLASCFDGIQNQNETGIDCGGPCKACEVKKFAKIPSIEIPGIFKIARQFPWLLILIVGILLTLTIASDQIYVRRITKKELEEYRESVRKYRAIRRKLYKFVINTAVITLIASIYIYFFSNNMENMIKYSWIPIILILLTPLVVSIVIRQYTYYEYRKRKKEQRLKQTHKRELLQLIKVENELLYDLELKLKNKIYNMAIKHKFDNYPALYNRINSIYGNLSLLEKKREERISLLSVHSQILDKILTIIENETLIKTSKEYPEFMSILKILKYIEDNKDLDTTDKEEEFLEEIEEISKPHMRTVIMSNKRLISLYNNLVDLYEYYTEKHGELRNRDTEIMNVERGFTDKIKEIAKKAVIMKAIQENPNFVSIYNNMVDLFNHYMKKHELSKSLGNI